MIPDSGLLFWATLYTQWASRCVYMHWQAQITFNDIVKLSNEAWTPVMGILLLDDISHNVYVSQMTAAVTRHH